MVGDKDTMRAAIIQAFSGRRRARLPREDEGADGVEHSCGTGLGERIAGEHVQRLSTFGCIDGWDGPCSGVYTLADLADRDHADRPAAPPRARYSRLCGPRCTCSQA